MKLQGFAAPYMLGLVVGVATISTAVGYKAEQNMEKKEQRYIQQKQEYMRNLSKSLDYVVSTENNYDNSITSDRLR